MFFTHEKKRKRSLKARKGGRFTDFEVWKIEGPRNRCVLEREREREGERGVNCLRKQWANNYVY